MDYNEMINRVGRISELIKQNKYFERIEKSKNIESLKFGEEENGRLEVYRSGPDTGIILNKLLKQIDLNTLIKTIARSEKEKNLAEIKELEK